MKKIWSVLKSDHSLNTEPNYFGMFQSNKQKNVKGALSAFLPIDPNNIPKDAVTFRTDILVHYSKKCPVKPNWKERVSVEGRYYPSTDSLELKLDNGIKYEILELNGFKQINGVYKSSIPPDSGFFYFVNKEYIQEHPNVAEHHEVLSA